jgi:hypothetical protein
VIVLEQSAGEEEKMEQARIQGRPLTALLMLLGFALLSTSGAVLFFAPRGHLANASGWELVGLTRWQWEDLHAGFALLITSDGEPRRWRRRACRSVSRRGWRSRCA